VGDVIDLKVMPDGLNVIEFGRIFRQPLDGERMGAGGAAPCAWPCSRDLIVIEHHNNGLGLEARLGAVGLKPDLILARVERLSDPCAGPAIER
jgi:hypothetical protein